MHIHNCAYYLFTRTYSTEIGISSLKKTTFLRENAEKVVKIFFFGCWIFLSRFRGEMLRWENDFFFAKNILDLLERIFLFHFLFFLNCLLRHFMRHICIFFSFLLYFSILITIFKFGLMCFFFRFTIFNFHLVWFISFI